MLFANNAEQWSLLEADLEADITDTDNHSLCAAHTAVMAATGYNAKIVSLGERLPSGLQLLSCELQHIVAVQHFPRRFTNGMRAELHDPYTLSHNDLVNPDLLIPLRHTYKSTPVSAPTLQHVNNSATITP
jgi:hypothetical protein